MEILLFLFGCVGWHLAVLAVGVWLGMAKPWRIARDYGQFREWQANQGQYKPNYEEEYAG
jgi:hypothetical protein